MNSQKIGIKLLGPSPKAYRKETRMTGTRSSYRSASLNMEGVDVKLLLGFLNTLPIEAQKTGKVEVSSTPYVNQFDRGSSSIKVSWHEDLGPAPAA